MHVLLTGLQRRASRRICRPRSPFADNSIRGPMTALDRIGYALYVRSREAAKRKASPTAGVIVSLSVNSDAALIRAAMTRARKSKPGSGKFTSTRNACRLTRSFTTPRFRSATKVLSAREHYSTNVRVSKSRSPTAIKDRHFSGRGRRLRPAS